MTFGSAAVLAIIVALCIGLHLGALTALKALFRWLAAKIERRDRIALGLPVDDEADRR